MKVMEYWWEGPNFHVLLENGEQVCLRNCYPVSLSFGDLQSSGSDVATIELTKRYQ